MVSPWRIVESVQAVERYEDWSRVRSPARAERRRKRGFRQNVEMRERPSAFEISGVIYIHPDLVRQVAKAAGDRVRNCMDKGILNTLYGRFR